jgi:hypothetical protein
LKQYQWRALDPVLLASTGRVIVAIALIGGIAWWARGLKRGTRLANAPPKPPPP